MIERIIRWLDSRLREQNRLHVRDRSAISATSRISGSRLYGPIVVGEGAKITDGVLIKGSVTIGRHTSISGPQTDIVSSVNPVTIGNFCSIARNVAIQESNHYLDRLSTYFVSQNIFGGDFKNDLYSKGPIVIGNDVWIGTQCVILSGVTIGNGAVVSANSVVTQDVPPYSIVGGSPARVLKFRFDPPMIEKLQQLEWWNWPMEKIRANRSVFERPFSEDSLSEIK